MVVVANGVWSNTLLESIGIHIPYRALRLQAAITEPAPFRFNPIVYGPSAAGLYPAFAEGGTHDVTRYIPPVPAGIAPTLEAMLLDCIAQRPDGRVLLGCPLDFPGIVDVPSVAATGWMMSSLTSLMPALGELAVERVWAGVAPMTADFLPVIDVDPGIRGLIVNSGHAFGNLSASASAALIRAQLDGLPVPVDPDDYRLDRPSLHTAGEISDDTL
jgi:glycine/D-amino acid oxidase-like deaminating enzyme